MKNDIKAYLYVFAKSLGHDLSENNDALNQIAEQIELRALSCIKECLFEQKIHSTCKKCKMLYEERGKITNKKYKYCISSGSFSNGMPPDCPKLGKSSEVFDNTKDDDIIEIRKRSR